MKKVNYLIILLLILAIVAGGLVAWRILNPPKEIPPTPTPTPTPETRLPTPTPTFIKKQKEQGDSPEELIKSLKQEFPLVEFVPYQTDEFSVNYQAPFHLKVKIKKLKDLEAIKQEVLNWINSKGVDPATHQIDWLTPEL